MTAMLNQGAHSGLLPFCRRFDGFVAGTDQEGRTSPSELPPLCVAALQILPPSA